MKPNAVERSFRDKISNLAYGHTSPVRQARSLQQMAEAARNYLERTPDPRRDYECKFEIGPLGIPYHHVIMIPPNEYGYDPISVADTDCRMDWQYIYMRRILGDGEKTPAEVGVRKRILSYLNEDGLCMVNPVASTGSPVEGLWPSEWGAGHILVSLGETYRDEPSQDVKDLAKKVFSGIVSRVWKDTGRLYYPYATPHKDGKWLSDGWAGAHQFGYAWAVEPMLQYYESFGEEEALAAAISFAEGQLWDLQEDQGTQRIDPVTGEFELHAHLHTRTIWGMAHLGYITGDSRYTDWAKRAYDFVMHRGSDFGWYPEAVPGYRFNSVSETCTVGDMTAIAYYLGRSGFTKCFDDIERTVVNYLESTQFRVDARFEKLFRKLHKDRTAEEIDSSLVALAELEGGFIAQTTINDLITRPDTIGQPGLDENGLHMMGCCPPSGMLALYYAWLASVAQEPEGVCVNTCIPGDSEFVSTSTNYAKTPATVLKIFKPGEYLIKLPAWVDRNTVSLSRNGDAVAFEWAGRGLAYIRAGELAAGDEIGLGYDIPTFVQELSCFDGREVDYKLTWAGNYLLRVDPDGEYLPLIR